MRRWMPALVLTTALMVLAGGVSAAIALPPGGGSDPGPYRACVSAKAGTLRMVDPGTSCAAKEYAIDWANGFAIRDYSNTTSYVEDHVTTTDWFHQLACPEGTEPLGGGGAFLADPGETGHMALQSSVPTVDEDLGGLKGWEVSLNTVDGLAHTGTFQIFVTCAPAELAS